MIVVRVELHSAISGEIKELARMHICNRGNGTEQIGNYDIRTLRGRGREQLDRNVVQRTGGLEGFKRLRKHVWVLVLSALIACGYHKDM